MALNSEMLKGFLNFSKPGQSVCMCVCMYCMRDRQVSEKLHFHLFVSLIHKSFCTDMYDTETIMIKQKIPKT